jgi:hypothetical protein
VIPTEGLIPMTIPKAKLQARRRGVTPPRSCRSSGRSILHRINSRIDSDRSTFRWDAHASRQVVKHCVSSARRSRDATLSVYRLCRTAAETRQAIRPFRVSFSTFASDPLAVCPGRASLSVPQEKTGGVWQIYRGSKECGASRGWDVWSWSRNGKHSSAIHPNEVTSGGWHEDTRTETQKICVLAFHMPLQFVAVHGHKD